MIDQLRNNCTLVAVREVSRLPDATILAAFRKRGYREHKGLPNHVWTSCAKDLGLSLEEVSVRMEGTYQAYVDRYGNERERYVNKGMTISEFARLYSEGVYFVSVPGHALVMRDGKVVDHNNRRTFGKRRRVIWAHRVLNAPAVPAPVRSKYVYFPKSCAKPVSRSKAYERFRAAWFYIDAMGEEVTSEQLTANTPYTKADFRHDLKKGIIAYREVKQ